MSPNQRLRHGMNCPGSCGYYEDCTCGLKYRDEIASLQRELEEARTDLEEYRKRYYAVQDSVTELQKALDTEVIFCRAERERAERAEAEVMLDASNRHLRDYAIKQRDEQIAMLTQERAAEVKLLSDLHAMVWGECPSLLDEDSGGCGRLDVEIRAALSPADPKKADHK